MEEIACIPQRSQFLRHKSSEFAGGGVGMFRYGVVCVGMGGKDTDNRSGCGERMGSRTGESFALRTGFLGGGRQGELDRINMIGRIGRKGRQGSAAIRVGNRARLVHGWDFNTSGKKAVSLETLGGFGCLKNFALRAIWPGEAPFPRVPTLFRRQRRRWQNVILSGSLAIRSSFF